MLSAGCNAEILMTARKVLHFLQLEQQIQISFCCKARPKIDMQRALHEQFKSELRTGRLLDEMVQRNVQPGTSVI